MTPDGKIKPEGLWRGTEAEVDSLSSTTTVGAVFTVWNKKKTKKKPEPICTFLKKKKNVYCRLNLLSDINTPVFALQERVINS